MCIRICLAEHPSIHADYGHPFPVSFVPPSCMTYPGHRYCSLHYSCSSRSLAKGNRISCGKLQFINGPKLKANTPFLPLNKHSTTENRRTVSD